MVASMTSINLIVKEYRVEKKADKGMGVRTRPYVDFICGSCQNLTSLPKSNYREDKSCSKCQKHETAKARFFIKAKEKFGNSYDLSKAVYVSPKTKLEVICTKHNKSHWVTPTRFVTKEYSHLKGHSAKGGCPDCAYEVQITKNQKGIDYYLQILELRFPQFTVVKHGEAVNNLEKLTLNCEYHGEFVTTLHQVSSKSTVHLCSGCNNDLNAWKTRMSRTDVKGKVYFVYLPDMSMFKCGVTYRDVKKRLDELKCKYEILWVLDFETLANAYHFEYQFFRHHKALRYKGERLIAKGGYTELMTSLITKPTKRFVEEILRLKEPKTGNS